MSDEREPETVMENKLKHMMHEANMQRLYVEQIKRQVDEFPAEIEGFFQRSIYNEKRLGNAFRTVRALRGMSQQELAFVSNINQTYICKIEGGQTNISVALLSNLCEALDIRVSELFLLLEESSSKCDDLPAFRFEEKSRLFRTLMRNGSDRD